MDKINSECIFGEVKKLEDIGTFINEALYEFKKTNITPITKVLIEIDEMFNGEIEPYIMGFEIKVINVDLHNDFKVVGKNE